MRFSRRVITTSLLSTVAIVCLALPSISANPPKTDALCAKKGLTKNYQGKKYTCVKSGKKLIWNKGVLVKQAGPAPATTSIPATTSKGNPTKNEEDLSRDPLVTPAGNLSSLEECKTEDQTKKDGRLNGPWSTSNGFPRPAGGAYGKSLVNVLVYPLEFSNGFPMDDEFIKLLKEYEKPAQRIYEKNSYGKVQIKFHHLPRDLWWKSDKPLHEWDYNNKLEDAEKIAALSKIFERADKQIDFDAYDTVMMISRAGVWMSETEAIFGATLKAPTGTVKNLVTSFGMTSGEWKGWTQWSWFVAHELGHSLYGLEDLYLQSRSSYIPSSLIEGDSERTPKGIKNDLMVGDIDEFIGWNRFLNGWLENEEVRCVYRQTETIHFLSDLNSPKGEKLLLLRLSEGVTVSLEVRMVPVPRLITTLIDSRIPHAYVPIRVGPTLSLESSLSSKGSLAGWNFEVLKANSQGLLFKVTRIAEFPVFATQPSGVAPSKPRSADDLGGQVCSKENEIVRNSEGEFLCLKWNDGLRWSKNNK